MADFHFLRPLWLIGIPLLVASGWYLIRVRSETNWASYIPGPKLKFLLVGDRSATAVWHHLLLAGWALACIGLAGPSWERVPVPVMRDDRALVILLDLSPSMLAQDLVPDRITRAKFKLIDVLRARGSGQTALIAYAGDAHTVAPLTDDVRTIEALLPALHPNMMPATGSDTEGAVRLARELLAAAGLTSGKLLLITDGIAPGVRAALREVAGENIRVSVLAVGTAEGAPIPGPDGGFIKDANSNIVLARLDEVELRALADQHGGHYTALRTDNSDVDYVLRVAASDRLDAMRPDKAAGDLRYDNWYDQGYWLVVLLLPLAVLAFRRGVLFACLLVLFVSGRPEAQTPETAPGKETGQRAPARGIGWADLWWTRDQQGARAIERGEPATAAARFRSPDWSGYAHYKNGDYANAEAKLRAAGDDTVSTYNLGNALAMQGKLKEAIASYDRALDRDPKFADAAHNKAVIEELLKKQEQQQQQDEGQQQGGESQPDQASDQPRRDAESSDQPQAGESSRQQQPPDAENYADTEQRAAPQSDQNPASTQSASSPEAEATPPEPADEPTEQAIVDAQEQLQDSSEQWLRGIPDDPSGLLRRKFEFETEQHRQQQRFGVDPSMRRREERY